MSGNRCGRRRALIPLRQPSRNTPYRIGGVGDFTPAKKATKATNSPNGPLSVPQLTPQCDWNSECSKSQSRSEPGRRREPQRKERRASGGLLRLLEVRARLAVRGYCGPSKSGRAKAEERDRTRSCRSELAACARMHPLKRWSTRVDRCVHSPKLRGLRRAAGTAREKPKS